MLTKQISEMKRFSPKTTKKVIKKARRRIKRRN